MERKKIKILIIQEWIPHYRLSLFNFISKNPKVALTVAYDAENGFDVPSNEVFFSLVQYTKNSFNNLSLISDLASLTKGYDRIVMVGNLHFLPTLLFLTFSKRKKLFFWGIGVSSNKGIKKKPIMDQFRFWLSDRSLGTILYSEEISEYYRQNVKYKEKVFSLPNTLEVDLFPFSMEKRKKILVLGSFKEVKRLDQVIIAFSNIVKKIPRDISLHIIGDGPEEANLKNLVDTKNLLHSVVFHGRMEKDTEIYPIISTSLVCVSPAQAGLSVLHSMAFGCPFLTSTNAITGGEKFNIENNKNGYFYDGTLKSLEDALLNIINNPLKNMEIARNAYEFYHKYRAVDKFADSFIQILNSPTS